MITVRVIYFLTAEGLELFPSWYATVAQAAAQQEGFIAIESFFQEKCPGIQISFINEEKLEQWAATTIHEKLLAQVQGYCQKPFLVDII